MSLGNNLNKFIQYMRKNGLRSAFHAAMERLSTPGENYSFMPITDTEREKQKSTKWEKEPLISIVVPTYETPKVFLKELVESVLASTYSKWELILADASSTGVVEETLREHYQDERIRYVKLSENKGISENTNEGIKEAKGEYTALLDHDDLITEDALYEMVCVINRNPEALMIYSDEDKCNHDASLFHTPHHKTDFNLDLFLTNNYICHFTMVRTALMKQLLLREDYDGAQDYDLFLRVVLAARKEIAGLKKEISYEQELQTRICHVPKILYHWRCHENSTSENPQSKLYAYDAGIRALDDFYKAAGIRAQAYHSEHLGFYEPDYDKSPERERREIGLVGGRLISKGKTVGGAMTKEGKLLYGGMKKEYSGYMNRASLCQNVEALDIRLMQVRKELEERYLFYLEQITRQDPVKLSLLFCEEVRSRGYLMLYSPSWMKKI